MIVFKFQFAYTTSPNPYQVGYATQPNAYSYAPLGIASPYTTSGYAATSAYGTGPIAAASLQQGQIIPYTTAANSLFLNPSNLQQYNFAYPGTYPGNYPGTYGAAATVQPLTAFTTASPIVPSVPKITSTVSPTTSAYYSAAPASQTYQQSPAFRKIFLKSRIFIGCSNLFFSFAEVSYANAASPLNYATGQKLFAVPSYTQAYRSVVAPTAATSSAASYTSAYIQPTGSAPVKVH